MKLIDKDTLVAEIEKQQRRLCILGQSNEVELRKNVAIQNGVYCSLLSFLNTLEVKEVDLKKEYKDFVEKDPVYNKLVNSIVGKAIAKHFFELGLKAAQKL